jgi:hypothetical protein
MTPQIHIGDKGKTLGPLKPTGRITVMGHAIDASSEGTWIDGDVDVVIVGGNTRQAIVRLFSTAGKPPQNNGEPLPQEQPTEVTPLQSPPAWVERIYSVRIGFVIGIIFVPIAWLFGTPLSVYALFVPVSGAIAGRLFRGFVGTAIETVGPRVDHRPQATAIALFIVVASLVGSAIGLNTGLGFLGLCCGLPLGALIGGMLAYVGWIVSNL